MLPATGSAEGILMGETVDLCGPILNTGAAEVMRQNFTEALDFVADFHSLTKIKVIFQYDLVKIEIMDLLLTRFSLNRRTTNAIWSV